MDPLRREVNSALHTYTFITTIFFNFQSTLHCCRGPRSMHMQLHNYVISRIGNQHQQKQKQEILLCTQIESTKFILVCMINSNMIFQNNEISILFSVQVGIHISLIMKPKNFFQMHGRVTLLPAPNGPNFERFIVIISECCTKIPQTW